MNKEIEKAIKGIGDKETQSGNSNVLFDKESLKRSISGVYSPGASFFYIYNHGTKQYTYLSENLPEILGTPAESFTPEKYYERIHPDDIAYIEKCKEIIRFFMYEHIDKSEIPCYKASYQFRMKNKLGKYKLMLHQSIAMSLDENGLLSSALTNESDISHITTTNNYKLSFIDIRGEKSYLNISKKSDLLKFVPSIDSISTREIEILRYLSEGFTSKEIADELHLAYDTIRTHRNNILKKTKFKTLTQVVAHFVKEGLI